MTRNLPLDEKQYANYGKELAEWCERATQLEPGSEVVAMIFFENCKLRITVEQEEG